MINRKGIARSLTVAVAALISLNVYSQSGGWDASFVTNASAGLTDHGNGVIQLIDTNTTGCQAAALHETTDTYNPVNDGTFSKCYEVFFGCPGNDDIGSDSKGDGMAFSFSACGSYTVGTCGGGLGYMNGASACGNTMLTIEFDTWSSEGNAGFDATFGGGTATGAEDEIAVHFGGNASDAGRLTSVNAGNLEDGLEHTVCIGYDPSTGELTVDIDGNNMLSYTLSSTYRLENYFGNQELNQTWSSGKDGATNPATVSDGADISDNAGSLCGQGVTLTSPGNGDVFASCERPITFTAAASAPIGETITSVEFFVNGSRVGTDNTEPYSFDWVNTSTGTHSITAEANFSDGSSNTSTAASITVGGQIDLVSSPPTIDGTPDAVWDNYVPISLNHSETGAADLSGSYKIAYDATNLYVLVDITDDVLDADDGTHWQNDGVEIYIDWGNNKPSSYGSDEYQYSFVYNNTSTIFGTNIAGNTTGIVWGYSTKAGGYYYEASFPWSTVSQGAGVPAADDEIGFEVMLNDADGGVRESRAAWTDNTYSSWNNPSLFGNQEFSNCDPLLPYVIAIPSEFCPGETVELRAYPQDASYDYEWLLNGVSQGPATTADTLITVTAGGDYSVRVDDGSSTETSTTTTVIENSLPTTADAGTDDAICSSDAIMLAANAAGAGETGTWSGGTGTFSTNSTDEAADYTVSAAEASAGSVTLTWTIDNGDCPASSDDVVITIDAEPTTADAGPGVDVDCSGMGALQAVAVTTGTGTWSGGLGSFSTNVNDPTATYSAHPDEIMAGSVILTWTSSNGSCTPSVDTMTFSIGMGMSCELMIPTAFSPNDDNINDVWEIDGSGFLNNATVAIYNRWGSLIWESEGLPEFWDGMIDGERVPPAVYYYTIKFNDGSMDDMSGSLSVIY